MPPRPVNLAQSKPNVNKQARGTTAAKSGAASKKKAAKPDRAKPHVCPTCTRAFARLEHLKRHQRSHTNEKPYQCAACGRCFARRDLVLRHQQKLHTSLPTNNRTEKVRPRGERLAPKEGQIVSDYLNNNINIIRNNTHRQLPLPDKSKQIAEGVYLVEDLAHTTPASQTFSPTVTSTSSSGRESGPELSQFQINQSRPLFPPARLKRERSDDTDHPTYRDRRHNSFSAAASSSYTGFIDLLSPNPLSMLEQEAPTQVNFSSPQLTHADGRTAYMNIPGLDQLELPASASFQLGNPHSDSNLTVSQLLDRGSDLLFTKPETSTAIANAAAAASKQESSVESSVGSSNFPQHHSLQTPVTIMSPDSPSLPKTIDPVLSLDSTVDVPMDDWIDDFINAPVDKDVPLFTDHIGFADSPSSGNSQNTPPSPSRNLSQYFRSRQIDLFNHLVIRPDRTQKSSSHVSPGHCSEAVHEGIIKTYNLEPSQLPPVEELNHYLALFELEFNKYFPFIHIPSLDFDKTPEEAPLLLAMAAIGALYSFHARNSTSLFNLSRFLIHNFMEDIVNSHDLSKVPLYITQSLVLHIFLGMFHNDSEVTKMVNRQISSLVSLVKATRLCMPLESLKLPPSPAAELSMLGQGAECQEQLRKCHDYFVLSQSRIRTLHVLHYLCVLYSTFTGSEEMLGPNFIRSGCQCAKEELWKAKSANEWLNLLKNNGIVIDSKFSLIRISNGMNSYRDLWRDLTNLTLDKDIGYWTLLSLLISLNGYIHDETLTLVADKVRPVGAKIAKWRMDDRPYIESALKTWETCYIRNGGLIVPRGQNLHVINRNAALKLILPLLSYAKVRKCINTSAIMSAIWNKDWDAMNTSIDHLNTDPEAFRDSITYCLDIVNLWIDILSISNDAEKTSIRTPIFVLTCLVTAITLMSEYLHSMEIWASKYEVDSKSVQPLATADKVLWLRSENILKKVEKNLLPKGANNTSYSEMLRIQANGALDIDQLDDEIARLALNPENTDGIAQIVSKGRLSSRCLSLGVRILADAPVWPIALVFAEALKMRATTINDHLSPLAG